MNTDRPTIPQGACQADRELTQRLARYALGQALKGARHADAERLSTWARGELASDRQLPISR